MIKRKYTRGEEIQTGCWFVATSVGGERFLRRARSEITVGHDLGWDYYEVDQVAAETAMTPPREPQHGEIWLVRNSVQGTTIASMCCDGELYTGLENCSKDAYRRITGRDWDPLRMVGTWLE